MKIDIRILGTAESDGIVNRIMELLEGASLENIEMQTCPNFDSWLSELSDEPLPGLADACWDWIRSWGNGGGDLSTEVCIKEAITELKSDSPRALAQAIYGSVSDYSKTPFEASTLTMTLLAEAQSELEAEQANELESEDEVC